MEESKMQELRSRADKLAEINKYRDVIDSGQATADLGSLGLDLSVLNEKELRDFNDATRGNV